jgi:hypothetical protein
VGSEFSCQNSHRWDTVTANATVPAGRYTATWYDRFPGGCVTHRLDSTTDIEGNFAVEAPLVVGFATRQQLRQALDERSNGRLHLDPASTG